MHETIDYEQLLASLKEEQENIGKLIVWVEGRMAQQDGSVEAVLTPAPKQPASGPMRFPRLAADSFFRMSVPQAIKSLLNIAKRPRTAKDITDGLKKGGLTSQAKNLYGTVYPTLLRMEKAGDVVRVSNGEWGLAEWYPGARKTIQEEKAAGEA